MMTANQSQPQISTASTRTPLDGAHTSDRLNSLRSVSHWSAGSWSRPEPKSKWLVRVTCPTHPPSFVQIRPKHAFVFFRFWPDLSMMKNLLKKIKKFWIRIQIFTKIEWTCSRHTPNLSTKFSLKPSITFRDIVQHIVLGRSLNGEKSLRKFSDQDPSPDLHQNFINASLSYTQFSTNLFTTFWDILLTDRQGWKHNLLHLWWWR